MDGTTRHIPIIIRPDRDKNTEEWNKLHATYII